MMQEEFGLVPATVPPGSHQMSPIVWSRWWQRRGGRGVVGVGWQRVRELPENRSNLITPAPLVLEDALSQSAKAAK